MTTIPFGKFKGQPMAAQPTRWILWILATRGLRQNYPTFCRAALELLRARLHRPGAAEAELDINHLDPLW